MHGAWQEAVEADGRPRPGWRELLAALADGGGFAQRWAQGQRRLREHGATFHQFADSSDAARPWSLDPVPLLLASDEWDALERGVAQRAAAFAALIADCQGEQRLVADGLVPAGVIHAHPGFLRATRDLPAPGSAYLHTYACELIRGADGRWTVAADLCQAPSGAGFAVDSRLIMARVLGEAFRELRVQRVAGFFMHLRRALAGLAPGRDNPRTVVLTPGPSSETYFEHAFLARYLGYTLAQGDDLTVRDERVFLKTLGGLHQVDVILRRLADDWCDPLELRNESLLGTLGLTAAARAGGVAIANALGSGVGEAPAWLAYLPAACRHLLGEEPRLAAQPTWWGGAHPQTLADPELLVRPAFDYRARPLDPTARTAQADDLRARPHAWVAQRPLVRSQAPCWEDGRLQLRPVSIRLFAVHVDGTWEVLPGGVARIAGADDPGAAWQSSGGASKDIWVRARGPVPEVSLLPDEGAPLDLRRGGIDLPSRVADGLFWLGRYAERLEDGARLVRAALLHQLDEGRALATWRALLASHGLAEADGDDDDDERHLIAAAARLDATHTSLRRNAAGVRDRLSDDTWRAIATLGRHVQPLPDERADACLGRLDQLVLACAALSGMGSENTTRGPGWMFLDLGRRIERAHATCELIQAACPRRRGDGLARASLAALLRAADSAITYRSRYLATVQAAPVVDLLVTDASNPRSVAFQAERIEQLVASLPHEAARALPATAERLAIRLNAAVRLADPLALCRDDDGGETLHAFLGSLADDLAQLTEALTTAYLTHVAPIRNQGRGM